MILRHREIVKRGGGRRMTMGYLVNVFVCAVSIAACTTLPPGSENRSSRFEIGVMGDQQYTAEDEAKFPNLMDDVNRSDLVFVVHVGDIAGDYRGYQEGDGMPPCTDETFLNRLELFNASRHPFILTPGDNEWTDCHASKTRKFDPLERLAKVRELFFQGDQSLGQRKLTLSRQSNDPRYANSVRTPIGFILTCCLSRSIYPAATIILAARPRWTKNMRNETRRISLG